MLILTVDDSSVSRKIIRRELEFGDYQVEEAESGREALDKLKTLIPDLITLDVNMTEMDGYQTALEIQKLIRDSALSTTRGQPIPIMFITGMDSIEAREKGFESGGIEFFTKPFESGSLLKRVNQILREDSQWEGLTALIVDDSEISRYALTNALTRRRINVLEAGTGDGGLKLACDNVGKVDIIIADYMMPGIKGDVFCQKLREMPEYRETPIIMLSGMSDRSYVLKMFKAGATDYIGKPFVIEELFARINVHLKALKWNRELKGKVIELERANKAKNDFLAITSHDIRSPLTSLKGYWELAMEDGNSREDMVFFDNQFQTAMAYITELVDTIMEVGKLLSVDEPLDLRPVEVMDVLANAMGAFSHQATLKKIHLDLVAKCPMDVQVPGDYNSLMRIFNNLISNAIKFTDKDGKVSVTVENQDQNTLVISVEDTGIGIPEEQKEGLFDFYTKASQAGTQGEPGTGLGMAITKKLVEKHSGGMEFISKVGEGTTFTITLPTSHESNLSLKDKILSS